MADSKISQLPPLTGLGVQNDDLLVLARPLSSENFSITREEFFTSVPTLSLGTLSVSEVNASDNTPALSISNSTGAVTFLGGAVGSLDGNASTATALQSPRVLTVGGTGKNFDGTANVSWSLSEIGVGTLGQQNSNNVAITGGTGAFTTLSASTSLTTPLITRAGTIALSATGANIITASTNGVERMRIASNGNVGIGTSSPATTLDVSGVAAAEILRTGSRAAISVPDTAGTNRTPPLMISGSSFATTVPSVAFYNTVQNAGAFNFLRSNTTTVGDHAIAANGNFMGALQWAASDGTNFIRAAQIIAQVDGTPATNDMPGRLVFLTTPSGSSTPVERLRINSSGNVGIGTTSPAHRLDVSGYLKATDILVGTNDSDFPGSGNTNTGVHLDGGFTSFFSRNDGGSNGSVLVNRNNSDGALISFRRDGSQIGFIGAASNGLTLAAGGTTERLRITSAGNVGIGTSSPITELDVNGDIRGIQLQSRRDGGDPISLVVSATSAVTPNVVVSHSRGTIASPSETLAGDRIFGILARGHDGTDYTGFSAGIQLHAEGSGSAGGTNIRLLTSPVGSSSRAERMRITGAGNVGIGTSSPSQLLHVDGGASSGIVRISASGFTGLELQKFVANADALINLRDNGNLRFQTNNTERLRITSAGNVGIGTSNPGSKLSIVGLPTSPSGLSSGDVWNDGGTLKIV